MVEKRLINQKNLSEQVKEYIKRRIEKGELKPGDRIREKEYCEKLGLSRTPVREALIQLSGEGIVEMLPRRLIKVKTHSLKDIKNLYTIISALEAEAAESAVDVMTEADIAELERLYAGMKVALEQDNYPRYKKLNDLSHDYIVEKMGNETLNELIANLKKRFFDFPLILSGIPEWLNLMLSDHRQMIDMLKQRDKPGIRQLIKEHWSYERNVSFKAESKGAPSL